jgi:hypothetical protein
MRMSSRASLAGVTRLLIDGNNLLHRTAGTADSGAQRALLARLRGALPADVHATLMLDGHAAAGTDRRQRIAGNLEIHHAGSLTADDALLNIVRDQPAQTRAALTLVTDDRGLTDKARHLGAHTRRLDWLEEVLAGGGAAKVGIGGGGRSAARARQDAPSIPSDAEREPWKPGRGATRKKGNPRRGRP